ncbi:hypothetical protein EEB11_02870 [Pseudotabrizicola sediminis]|uniref:Serine hydrolase n=1 Tax=Pseudotabrizicola sediminis TaxID=2486418 RepID=A0ABY2KPF8_9RHOB|nr:hypothetical protein [Pseudotabrizicola sediminis]TGD44548.1 hypothetical protein EEB11_02870 [Pseudotabrizicola sediminis]
MPENQVTALVDGLRAEIGPVLLVDLSGGRGHVQTASHRVPVRITLDAQGRIAGLFVEPAERLVTDLAAALTALRDVADNAVWLVSRDGEVLAAEGADYPVPVASAFKLSVLSVLADDRRSARLGRCGAAG